MTGDELRSFVDSNDIRTVRLLASLPDGRLVGKYLAAGHLIDMFPTRPNISDVILSLDAANAVIATAWSAWRGEMAELYLDADLAKTDRAGIGAGLDRQRGAVRVGADDAVSTIRSRGRHHTGDEGASSDDVPPLGWWL